MGSVEVGVLGIDNIPKLFYVTFIAVKVLLVVEYYFYIFYGMILFRIILLYCCGLCMDRYMDGLCTYVLISTFVYCVSNNTQGMHVYIYKGIQNQSFQYKRSKLAIVVVTVCIKSYRAIIIKYTS